MGVICTQADCSRDQPSHILCGLASQQLADWVAAHIPSVAGAPPGALLTLTNSVATMMAPAACVELFARLSALFTPPGSTHALWQLAAAVAGHLGDPECCSPTGESLTRSASALPMRRLSSAVSVPGAAPASGLSPESKSCSVSVCGTAPGSSGGNWGGSSGGAWGGSSGSSSCTGPGCLCHLVRVKAGLVSTANQAELSVRGRGVGRAVMGASRREEVLQEAALMHLQAGDAERCCELLAEVSRGTYRAAHEMLRCLPADSMQGCMSVTKVGQLSLIGYHTWCTCFVEHSRSTASSTLGGLSKGHQLCLRNNCVRKMPYQPAHCMSHTAGSWQLAHIRQCCAHLLFWMRGWGFGTRPLRWHRLCRCPTGSSCCSAGQMRCVRQQHQPGSCCPTCWQLAKSRARWSS